jgi:enoyl-CoA hydratase
MMEFDLRESVALLSFDDGKANAVGHDFLDAMNAGLDQAEKEARAVVIQGRTGVLSGGFDLKEFQKGAAASAQLIDKGAHTLLRLFSHPQPVVIACCGHAIAAGGFLLLTADNRIGGAGDFKIGLTETALGMTFPVFGRELAKARLDKAHLTRSFVQSHVYSPDDAVKAGFLDRVLPLDQVLAAALQEAEVLGELPGEAYAQNKRDIRGEHIAAIAASLS